MLRKEMAMLAWVVWQSLWLIGPAGPGGRAVTEPQWTALEPFETKRECLKGIEKHFKLVVDGKIGGEVIGKTLRGPSDSALLTTKNEKGFTSSWTWECWPAGTTPTGRR